MKKRQVERIIVEGIPNIRITKAVEESISDLLDDYIAKNYPEPDCVQVKLWLEKVGNEAYPKEHQDILGFGTGYGFCINKDLELMLGRDDEGKVYVRLGGWKKDTLFFTIRAFDLFSSLVNPFFGDTPVIKHINKCIQEDPDKLVLNYVNDVIERRKIVSDLRDSWQSSVMWAQCTQELPEDMQRILKDAICDTYVTGCAALDSFKRKIEGAKK